MNSLLITPENKKDLKFIKELLSKLGYSIKELNEEDLEDIGLLQQMVKEKKGEYVSEDEINKALGQ